MAWLTFDGSNELTSVVSTPFNPVQGTIAQSKYNGTDQAWFSLIFVGNYAQLIWFDDNPGNALLDPVRALRTSSCPMAADLRRLLSASGDNVTRPKLDVAAFRPTSTARARR